MADIVIDEQGYEDYTFVNNILDLLKDKIGEAGKYIPVYNDVSGTVDSIYIDEVSEVNIKERYGCVLMKRNKLSGLDSIDFTSSESDFVSCLRIYLDSIRLFFREIFRGTEHTSAVVCQCILKQIIEGDMLSIKEGNPFYEEHKKTIYIKLGNPIILESLYLTMLQYEDFNNLCTELKLDKNCVRYKLYWELFENKVCRLFRDIIVLFEKEYYRIVDFDRENKAFVARRENDLSSIEKISAFRLYEKIIDKLEEKSEKTKFSCLIVGSVKAWSKDLLQKMLDGWMSCKEGAYTVEVQYLEDKKGIRDTLSNRINFMKKVRDYDKVFVLDCPSIYSDISLREMSDDAELLNISHEKFSSLFSIDGSSRQRDFCNKNGFATIYYRIQNYLANANLHNSKKTRCINRDFLNYLDNIFDCDEKGRVEKEEFKDKEVYILISNEKDFKNELFDLYNFTRVEGYNSKDCRVIKFSQRPHVHFVSMEREIRTTYYNVLKVFSNLSESFFCEMTGVHCGHDAACLAIRMAQNTKIDIHYSRISYVSGTKLHMDIAINVTYPVEYEKCEFFDSYMENVKEILMEAFNSDSEDERIENVIILKCFRKTIASVINSSARNYNDLLFYHLYKKLYEKGESDIEFKIIEPINFVHYVSSAGAVHGDDEIGRKDSQYGFCYSHPGNDFEETTSYYRKREACAMMDDMDSRYYTESNIMYHVRVVMQNKENLSEYVRNIRGACRTLGYTESELYHNTGELYK